MRERGIVGVTRRRRRSLTKQDQAAASAPHLIGGLHRQAPGQRFVGDITHLPTAEGWLYLATTINLYNREVSGDRRVGRGVQDAPAPVAGHGLPR